MGAEDNGRGSCKMEPDCVDCYGRQWLFVGGSLGVKTRLPGATGQYLLLLS